MGKLVTVVVAVALAAGAVGADPPRRLNVQGLGRLPAFSHAAIAGDLVFLSGTLGTAGDAFELVPGGAGAETSQAIANMERVLAGVGASLADVAKCTVFLGDMKDYEAMNASWIAAFGETPPARSTVGVAGLALGAALEVECIAQLPAGAGG